jgi:hypothetical protein
MTKKEKKESEAAWLGLQKRVPVRGMTKKEKKEREAARLGIGEAGSPFGE